MTSNDKELGDVTYPISEIFTSPQGEGLHTGTMMTFIRLAGCSVGRPYKHTELRSLGGQVVATQSTNNLPIYTEECTTYDGRKFACDTDYRVKRRMPIDEILSQVPANVSHVCISGGEPFIHNLVPLVGMLDRSGKSVHIETSGTIPLRKAFPHGSDGIRHYLSDLVWITVSPKLGVLDDMIARADEIKLLVDEGFDFANVPELVKTHSQVYIQPINDENTVRPENIRLCMELQRKHPNWKLSLQLHKVLEHFIEERVR